jgi:hypothetical protein
MLVAMNSAAHPSNCGSSLVLALVPVQVLVLVQWLMLTIKMRIWSIHIT